MALEQFKAQIAILFQDMVNQPEDAHELQEQIREKFAELRAQGLPLPQDLFDLEKRLDDDFSQA